MAVRYAVERFKVGFGTDKKEAYVGRIQLGETVDTDMLVEQVSLRTGMNEAQVRMLFDNLTDSILHFCKLGSGVRLGKLGIIKPALNSKSAESADDVMVQKIRYRFLPSVQMKEALRELEIRKLGDETDSGVVDDGDDDEESGGGQEFT